MPAPFSFIRSPSNSVATASGVQSRLRCGCGAVAVAAVVGSDVRVTIAWLCVGVCLWTVGLVAGSVAGVSLLGLA